MEYGYEIIDTTGNKTLFVEGCTYCSMTTGGSHEQHCPLWRKQKLQVIHIISPQLNGGESKEVRG